MIDFGLSRSYLTEDLKHIPEAKAKHFVGTAGFSSLNSHTLIEQTRRDDLEGLAYIMLYLRGGPLPWHKLQGGNSRQERYNLIVQRKFATSVEEIIKEDMPCKLLCD